MHEATHISCGLSETGQTVDSPSGIDPGIDKDNKDEGGVEDVSQGSPW
jgi:hypothetical protein